MVVVAIAGASTGPGAQLVSAIIAANKHTLIVLSRKPSPAIEARGVEVRILDYTRSVDELAPLLAGIDTIVSMLGAGAVLDAQLKLIHAAHQAGVRRFAPSELGLHHNDFTDRYRDKDRAFAELKKTGMEATRYMPGLFLNSLATGTPRGEADALAGMRPWHFVLNVLAGTADLPGNGFTPLSLTTTWDIARFITATLDDASWPEYSYMEGDRKSYRELINMLEHATCRKAGPGVRKFLLKENSSDDMRQLIRTNPASEFFNDTRIALNDGIGITGRVLNDKHPEIIPTTAQEFIERYWGGVEVDEAAWAENRVFDVNNMTR